MAMNQNAQPDKATALQSAWPLVPSAMMIAYEGFILLIYIHCPCENYKKKVDII